MTLLFVRSTVPESRGDRSRLDLSGTVLITLAPAAIVLALVEGREHGWPEWTWVSFGSSPLLLTAFVLQQRRRSESGRAPLVPFAVFGTATFRVGSIAALTFGLVPSAFFFVLALYLQQGRGFSPVFSGSHHSATATQQRQRNRPPNSS